MFQSIFNIDLNREVANVLVVPWRKTKFVQWLMCLIHPVNLLLTSFLRYRTATNYKLDHTAQVFSLEDVLNDAFDATQRRIYINDGIYTFPVWFYDRNDDKPVYFFDRATDGPVRFYNRASLAQLDEDFTVVIPAALGLPEAEIIRLRALIDLYRLPDKTYTLSYE